MFTQEKAESVFRRNSRTFSLAAKFFHPRDRLCVAQLYCFCRYVDDLADATATGEPDQLAVVREILLGERIAVAASIEADFLRMAEIRRIPLAPAVALTEALKSDCGSRSIPDEDGLICFAYGVAGTVGLLLQKIIGAEDTRAAAFAVDLGIALQMTNIARDIAEDAAHGRYYLPGEWVEPETINRALRNKDAAAAEQVEAAVIRLLDLAERYYLSARQGHWFIPSRNRRVIFLAATLYRAIGQGIRSGGPGAWKQRTVLSGLEKASVIVRALPEYSHCRRSLWKGSAPKHKPELHRPLAQAGVREGVDPHALENEPAMLSE